MPTQEPRAAAAPARSGSRWFGRLLSPALRRRVAAALCSAPVGTAVGVLYRDRVPCYGLRFHVPSPPVSARTKAQMRLGIYEGTEIRFVRRWLRPDLDVVELGSSLGVVSSHCAQRLAPESKLVCVEANPSLIPILRENLARHAPGRDVRVVGRAIDYDRPEVRLRIARDTSGSRVGAEGEEGVRVPTTTLGELLKEQGIRRYALVSDIEGAEAGILEEDLAALEGCQQVVAELHATERGGRRLRVEDLVARLQAAGLVERDRHGPVVVFERPGR